MTDKKPYLLNGKVIPSTTQVIAQLAKDGLLDWAYYMGKTGQDMNGYKQYKADIGTATHWLIEQYEKGIPIKIDNPLLEEAELNLDAYIEWKEKQKHITCLDIEREFIDEKLKYGSRVDLIFKIVLPTMVDIKTGRVGEKKVLFDEIKLQMAAYYHQVKREYPLLCENILILQVREGEVKEWWYEYDPTDFEVFKHLLKIWWLRNA